MSYGHSRLSGTDWAKVGKSGMHVAPHYVHRQAFAVGFSRRVPTRFSLLPSGLGDMKLDKEQAGRRYPIMQSSCGEPPNNRHGRAQIEIFYHATAGTSLLADREHRATGVS